MSAIVDLQLVVENSLCPEHQRCVEIVSLVLKTVGIQESRECTIRIVDIDESAELNLTYRAKTGATNVLSFPFEAPVAFENMLVADFETEESLEVILLGDLVICAPLVAEEAVAQNKSELSHWTHLVIHGVLHLLGHDHETDADANEMETIEKTIMDDLGYPNPYISID